MTRTKQFPRDQAEIVCSDVFVEQLAEFTDDDKVDVLADIHRLCDVPEGRHALGGALAGWNTVDVLSKRHRVVYRISSHTGTGLVEVLCLGPRRSSEVYDIAVALVRTGVLDPDEVTQLWEALSLFDLFPETIGLDGWDYRPPPAPDGMVRAAAGAGVLPAGTAALLSKDELEAALAHGWSPDGTPNPAEALRAALQRARGRVEYPGPSVILDRTKPRCDALMPRAGARCIRTQGHPGAHRSR